MKKIFFACLLIIIFLNFQADNKLMINGLNEIDYIYKATEDSLNHFFKDKFAFNLYYNDFIFGMKFIAELPKYDNFQKVKYLSNEDLSYRWDERYVAYNGDKLSLLAGTLEESFGTGLTFRSYQDEDFDIDTRLEGVLVKLNLKKLKIKALYGSLPDENRPVYNDLTYGIDLEKKLFDSFSFGLTAVSFRHIHSIGNLYNKFDVLGSRISLNSDVFDFYSEYAQLKETNNEIDPAKEGFAGYSNLNVYVGNFTFSGSYKKYEDFNYRLNDLPTVNYSSEPLAETIKIGTEEEGIMGEISFVPNFDNELIVNYAEAWNKDFTIRQNDAYAEFRHDFANSSLIAEHSHLERIDNNSNEWEQISKPALSFDFMLNEIPIYLKTEYEIHRKDHSNSESKYYEPLFQVDVEINNIGISLIAEYQYNSWDNLLKNPLWLGAEFSFDVLENTDLKLFAGKEKGGKVCRNGTCRYQSRFEGIRMELNTSF